MLLQQIIVGLIALGAAAYVVRIVFKSFQADKGCGGNCKCTPAEKVTPH